LTRAVRRCAGASYLTAGALLVATLLAQPCQAQAVRGEASLNVSGGYARLVLKLAEDVESEVSMAGTILVMFPLLVAFLLFQRQFINSFVRSGLK